MSCVESEVLKLLLNDEEVRRGYEQLFFAYHLYYGLKIEYDVTEFWEEFDVIYFVEKNNNIKQAVLDSFERMNEKAIFHQFG